MLVRCLGYALSVSVLALPSASFAADCTATSIGAVPLDDLGAGTYLGFEGGLYPGGSNTAPAAHDTEGRARAVAMAPLDGNGLADANGAVVMVSIGMSNTTQEFCAQNGREPCDAWTFMGQAASSPDVDTQSLVLINGARSGQAAATWESPTAANYDLIRDGVLVPKGLTEAQVRAAWIKVANPGPTVALPSASADAFDLEASLGNIARAMAVRYPNLALVFLSSRIYAGYADTPLNPEPYAYESAFSVKWLIEAQIDQVAGGGIDAVAGDLDPAGTAPWLGWGPHLWADGETPRADGLVWSCTDLESDGTHPSMAGEQKVGAALLDFFLGSPYSKPWFSSAGPTPVPVFPTTGGTR